MKKNISLLLCLGVLLTTTSCEKFLEESPKSSITSASYITTEDQLISNTNILYRSGAPTMYSSLDVFSGTYAMIGGFVSGYFDNEFSGQEVVVSYSQSLLRTSANIASEMDGIWDSCYSAINIANQAIQDGPEIDGISSSVLSLYIAESKFFRALNYFYMVKTWGDVPLILTPSSSIEGLEVARTASSEVYNQIISDLTDAVADLPSGTLYSNSRRITSSVANTLLADVYLQMSGYPLSSDHYADAANAARAVISSGSHSLATNDDMDTGSAYNKLRTTDELSEAIYCMEFNATISSTGYWPAVAFSTEANGWGYSKYSVANNCYKATNGILNMYDPSDDLRIQDRQFFVTEYIHPTTGEVHTLSFPCNYLFYDEDAYLNTGIGTKDKNIYRYAEVLLIAAEAIAKSGGDMTEARGYLAEVMARASMSKDQSQIESELASLSTEKFIEAVWAERLRELVLETKIWDDVCRTRKYPQFDEDNLGTVSFVDVIGASNNWGKTFAEKDLLWPISANELQRNTSLTQNTGY